MHCPFIRVGLPGSCVGYYRYSWMILAPVSLRVLRLAARERAYLRVEPSIRICTGTNMSVTFTVRIPRRLAEKMKRHSEINWSEVVRKSIEDYLERLEEAKTRVSAAEVLEELREMGLDEAQLEPLELAEERKLYEEMVKREWKRLSMIRAQ